MCSKIVIENAGNLTKKKENELYILKKKIYPGQLYRIRNLVLLCSCYEVNEHYEPTTYFLLLLEGNIKKAINSKNIRPINLVLINTEENENNYIKTYKFYKSSYL